MTIRKAIVIVAGLLQEVPAGDFVATDWSAITSVPAIVTNIAAIGAGTGLIEKTGVSSVATRAIGVGTSSAIPTRADADARFAAIVHTHVSADITDLESAAHTFTAANVFQTASKNGIPILVESTAAVSSTIGPFLQIRVSGATAATGALGSINFQALNSVGGTTGYARINGRIASNTDAAESGILVLQTQVGGVFTDILTLNNGAVVGTAVDQGVNTFNAATIYENATSLAAKYLTLSGGTLTGALRLPAGSGTVPALQLGGTTEGFSQLAASSVGLILGGATKAVFGGGASKWILNGDTFEQIPSGSTNGFQVQGTTAAMASLFNVAWTANAQAGTYRFAKSRNAALNGHTVVQSGDLLGTLQWYGDDGSDWAIGGSIAVAVDGTPGAGDMPGRLVFSTTPDGASTVVERLRIDSTGALIHQNNARTIVTSASHLKLRVYTVSGLPASPTAGELAYVSDAPQGAPAVAVGDSANWKYFYAPENSTLFRASTADAAGTNGTAAQPWFPSNGGVTLEASTSYFFEGELWISRAAGVTSHTTGLLFGGTATLTSIGYRAVVTSSVGNVLTSASILQSAVETNTTVTAASTSATEFITVRVQGIVRINAAGTFIPQFKYSATPGGAPTILANSHFRLTKMGNNTVSSNGTWA